MTLIVFNCSDNNCESRHRHLLTYNGRCERLVYSELMFQKAVDNLNGTTQEANRPQSFFTESK